MSIDVIMPQMGESIFEGTITKWLKKAGDAVEKDEPLFEISTDKVDAEIPSPVAGILTEIKIEEGATVQVNTIVAVIDGASSVTKPVQESAPPQMAQVVQSSSQGDALVQGSAPPQVEVVMPQMGESIFEGTITKWLKKVGDAVQKDEPLFEISTDKVDAEIPAPVAGVLSEILIEEGATIQINTVVATIGVGLATTSLHNPAATRLSPPQGSAAQAMDSHPKAPYVAPAIKAVPASEVDVPGRRIRSSPLARRIAKEHGIDLNRIAGTGQGGRIAKEDVLRAVSQSQTLNQRSAPPQVVPLSRMRAIIAERMVQSKHISPHVHTVYKVDMTRVVHHRDRRKDAFEKQHGIKLTFMPYVAAAVVAALQRYPVVNASLESSASGLGIRYHQNINLGIAVALDWGLIVPVVRQAEGKNFAQLARTIVDLAGRARNKKLSPDEVGGSTFTLTNSGVFGDEFSTPIINQPESAILCISGLKKEPVVLTDEEGDDTIAIRSMQHFTLGFDHRLIDGADACKFMLELKRTLESWDQEL